VPVDVGLGLLLAAAVLFLTPGLAIAALVALPLLLLFLASMAIGRLRSRSG
jgi:hypothetical protein